MTLQEELVALGQKHGYSRAQAQRWAPVAEKSLEFGDDRRAGRWRPVEREALKALADQHLNRKTIAGVLCRNYYAVCSALSQQYLRTTYNGAFFDHDLIGRLYMQGLPVKKIALQVGCSQVRVKDVVTARKLPRRYQPRTPETAARAVR